MEFPYIVRQNLVIIDASNPRYVCSNLNIIDMTLTVADAVRGPVELEFSAHADDTEEHGRRLHAYGLTLGPAPCEFDPEKAKRQIADRRYTEETKGITLGGMKIDTGRDSQGLITGATLASVLDPAYVCNWKTPLGFIQLDAAALATVSQAVRTHVQSCFDREATLLAALSASTYTEAMLNTGWPTYE